MALSFDGNVFRTGSGTVGTTATNFAHNCGTQPRFVILTVRGTVAGVMRMTALDVTNITVVSTLASTTFDWLTVV